MAGTRGKAAPRFSDVSLEVLLEAVRARREVLYPQSGRKTTNSLTHKAWLEVAEEVSCRSITPRTWIQCRKRFNDLTRSAKEKTAHNMREKMKAGDGEPELVALNKVERETLEICGTTRASSIGDGEAGGFSEGGQRTPPPPLPPPPADFKTSPCSAGQPFLFLPVAALAREDDVPAEEAPYCAERWSPGEETRQRPRDGGWDAELHHPAVQWREEEEEEEEETRRRPSDGGWDAELRHTSMKQWKPEEEEEETETTMMQRPRDEGWHAKLCHPAMKRWKSEEEEEEEEGTRRRPRDRGWDVELRGPAMKRQMLEAHERLYRVLEGLPQTLGAMSENMEESTSSVCGVLSHGLQALQSALERAAASPLPPTGSPPPLPALLRAQTAATRAAGADVCSALERLSGRLERLARHTERGFDGVARLLGTAVPGEGGEGEPRSRNTPPAGELRPSAGPAQLARALLSQPPIGAPAEGAPRRSSRVTKPSYKKGHYGLSLG